MFKGDSDMYKLQALFQEPFFDMTFPRLRVPSVISLINQENIFQVQIGALKYVFCGNYLIFPELHYTQNPSVQKIVKIFLTGKILSVGNNINAFPLFEHPAMAANIIGPDDKPDFINLLLVYPLGHFMIGMSIFMNCRSFPPPQISDYVKKVMYSQICQFFTLQLSDNAFIIRSIRFYRIPDVNKS